MTTNKNHVWSVDHLEYLGNLYVLCSGYQDFLDIFRYQDFDIIHKYYNQIFSITNTTLPKLISALKNEQRRYFQKLPVRADHKKYFTPV